MVVAVIIEFVALLVLLATVAVPAGWVKAAELRTRRNVRRFLP